MTFRPIFWSILSGFKLTPSGISGRDATPGPLLLEKPLGYISLRYEKNGSRLGGARGLLGYRPRHRHREIRRAARRHMVLDRRRSRGRGGRNIYSQAG